MLMQSINLPKPYRYQRILLRIFVIALIMMVSWVVCKFLGVMPNSPAPIRGTVAVWVVAGILLYLDSEPKPY